jgi:SAM-dependent methyltransferase
MKEEKRDSQTHWRASLEPDWEERRKKTDWKGIPEVHDYVARLMTGKGLSEGGDWLTYSREKYLLPLVSSLHQRGIKGANEGLSLVSFGCGLGHIEKALFEADWPIGSITCREYDSALLEQAARNLEPFRVKKRFEFFDFNEPPTGSEQFDVVFFCHALHHCNDLERFLTYANGILGPDSLLMGVDYFGPPRLQVEYEVLRLIRDIYNILPDRLKVNLQTDGRIEKEFVGMRMSEVQATDPTEAPRSSDLRSLLFALFEIVQILPMGGTILRQLLAHRAGNFRSEDDFALLRLIMLLEGELIKNKVIRSDDLYFVLKRGCL